MRILVDIGHPAHVHLFRHCILSWRRQGHQILIAIRKRGIVPTLLESYGLQYEVISKPRQGLLGLAFELIEHDWGVFRLAIRQKSDVLIGTSVAVAHVSRITSARSVVLNEDDADSVPLFSRLTYPFANTIVTPQCVRDQKTSKYVTYNSYHELAYLHPNHFQPDPRVYECLGITSETSYFIIRLVALKAHHDRGIRGISREMVKKLVDLLSTRGRVFVTAEGDLIPELRSLYMPIPPHWMHHALAYASMVISDSQTLTAEAAVLGTPAVRYNSFVGRISYLEELEHRYGLTYGFRPDEEGQMFAKIEELLAMPDILQEWQQRRRRMLAEKIDFAAWLTHFVANYPQSFIAH